MMRPTASCALLIAIRLNVVFLLSPIRKALQKSFCNPAENKIGTHTISSNSRLGGSKSAVNGVAKEKDIIMVIKTIAIIESKYI